MTEEVKKVSEEQLKVLRELTEKLSDLNAKYGELAIQRRWIEKEIRTTELSLETIEQQRTHMVFELENQLGPGAVNLKDGTFIPDSK